MPDLSVVIITYNEEENIARCLDSVRDIASEIVVVDSFSPDRTAEICRSYGCRFIGRKFEGYAPQKQFAIGQAVNDWVLCIDADEEVSGELRLEIKTLMQSGTIPYAGYRIPRALFYMGRILKFSGVGNEQLLRLFNRTRGRVTELPVHESIEVEGPSGTLKGRLVHYSYNSIAQQLEKTNIYTSLAAASTADKGRSYPKSFVFLKFPVNFLVFYIIRGGILDGYPGLMWSFMAAFSGSIKIAKMIEQRQKS